MAWLALGLALLLLAVPGGRGKPVRFDRLALAACALAGGTAMGAFWVYPAPAAAAIALAAFGGRLVLLKWAAVPARTAARLLAVAAGLASSLFALFGPAEGLF